jgi:UPF0755 protein
MTRRQRTALVIIALVVVPLIVLASGGIWFWWQLDPPGGAGSKIQVEIARGCGVPCIGDELSSKGVIGSSFVFSVYSRLNGDSKYEAGTYELRKHMGVRNAVKTLAAGPRIDYTKLTVPPGLWESEIASRVAALGGRSADAFLAATQNNAVRSDFEPPDTHNLEGLLWPDTYKISASEDEIQVLQTMRTTFQEKAASLGLTPATTVQGHDAYDIIKIASLVEAEAKVPEDRPLIASVIYNRLAHNPPMQLQIDATLIYARGDPQKRTLTNADKQIKSPYNTYAHFGLPPTPIAAVSAASLEAALHPAQTNYLFYVVINKNGKHAFASTLQEHQHNIEIARQNGVLG